MSINPLVELQVRRNTENRNAWRSAAGHRERVTRLLAPEAASSRPRLCVLGAGNCSNLDLSSLLKMFDEIHLTDVDQSALAAAVERQHVDQTPSIRLHGDCEVTAR